MYSTDRNGYILKIALRSAISLKWAYIRDQYDNSLDIECQSITGWLDMLDGDHLPGYVEKLLSVMISNLPYVY